jgi:hypothetical protein
VVSSVPPIVKHDARLNKSDLHTFKEHQAQVPAGRSPSEDSTQTLAEANFCSSLVGIYLFELMANQTTILRL